MPPCYGACCTMTVTEPRALLLLAPILLLFSSLTLWVPNDQLLFLLCWKCFRPFSLRMCWTCFLPSLLLQCMWDIVLQGCSHNLAPLLLWRSVSRASSGRDTDNSRHFRELSNFKINIAICINYCVIAPMFFQALWGNVFKACYIVKAGWNKLTFK